MENTHPGRMPVGIGLAAIRWELRYLGDGIQRSALGGKITSWAHRVEDSCQKYLGGGRDSRRKEEAPESVGSLLDALPPGFFLLSDLRGGTAPIDHVLVGPKGLFVLKMQVHDGTVTVLADQIFRNGRSLDSDRQLIRDARQECRTLEELLARRGITELKPLPLIVFTKGIVGVHGTIRGLEVMHRDALPAFMKRRKDVISARDAEGIFEFLKIGRAQSPL